VQLVVSNLFGQNAPAIAATESVYEQMWAQDVSAMVGYHGGASAAAAQLSSWAEELVGLPAQVSAAIATSPIAPALSSLNSAASSPVGAALSLLSPAASSPVGAALSSLNPAASSPFGGVLAPVGGVFDGLRHAVIDVINAPTSLLFGQNLIASGPQSTGGSATISGSTATAPLTMFAGTEPLVNASVGGGSAVPLLVDTGSTGLVIPFTDVGGLFGLLKLGIPTGVSIGGYSGGLDYVYATYNTTVNFGGGLVTARTPVDVELFAFPTSLQSLQNNGPTFQSFFASDGAAGVLGVGPNAGGPGPSIPLQALPSPYNQGLLINENTGTAQPYLQFGGQPATVGGLSPIATLPQSPITNLNVSINGGTPQTVSSIVDSGGVDGTFPTGLNVAPGSLVVVSAPGGPELYQFVYNGNYFPTPISSGLMNTGNLIFQQNPVYINYGTGQSVIY
jgi:PPE-repeat protein